MNPFEENNDSEDTFTGDAELWLEVNGRRKNTFIINLPYSEEELKDHLKNIKKKFGCNGSLKEETDEKEDKKSFIIQLQGDHIQDLIKYFKDNKFTNIKIRGQ